MKVFTLDNYLEKKLKDREFKSHYDRELLVNAIAKLLVDLRHSSKLTQQDLAKKAHTTQSVIARLESGSDARIPSIELLARIATAAHAKLNINFTLGNN